MRRSDFRPSSNSSRGISAKDRSLIRSVSAQKKLDKQVAIDNKYSKNYNLYKSEGGKLSYKKYVEANEKYKGTSYKYNPKYRYTIYRYDNTPFENPKAQRYSANNMKDTQKILKELNNGKYKGKWVYGDKKQLK